MTLEESIAAAERTEAARHLIDQAQADVVDLVTVSALELCVLGGPAHPMFEEAVARAWMQLGNRRREKVIEWVTDGMIKRGLLIEDGPRTGDWQPGTHYALKPELGVMLAARCRPAFIVITELAGQNLRAPRFFALTDQAEPVRGIVAELPTAPPGTSGRLPERRQARAAGPVLPVRSPRPGQGSRGTRRADHFLAPAGGRSRALGVAGVCLPP